MNVIEIIQKYHLVVRCLPTVVISKYNYRDGHEKRLSCKYVDSNGNEIKNVTRSIETDESGNKFFVERKIPEKGSWWIVKQSSNTDSTVHFSFKTDFFAPTLEEAINLFLESITIKS